MTLREFLGALPHHQALAMRSEIGAVLNSIKQDMTSAGGPAVKSSILQYPVLLQQLDSIINLLRPEEKDKKILSLSELEEQV